ncbi:hypothetical protein JKF63_03866 [Porcisia hertigi]|uniref:Uncharacterized protein n=1 Tax=Porcisia hertigi TaxID=2761500 RepID=A0A836L3Q8_9TRYP|nr:hypothetical protein JKF63_03866 [Porcisia hertigi]
MFGHGHIGVWPPSATTGASHPQATPEIESRFRRATPVARSAYSIGYDFAGGESSEDPPKTSKPRDVDAPAGALSSYQRPSANTLQADDPRTTSQGGDGTTPVSRPSALRTGCATPVPSYVAHHHPTESVTASAVGNNATTPRNAGSYAVFASVACAPESLQAHERASNSVRLSTHSAYHHHQNTSTRSSPLSPQRPTLEARGCVNAHSCSDADSSRDFMNTAMSPVLELPEGHEMRSCDVAEDSLRPAPTTPEKTPVNTFVTQSTPVHHEPLRSGKPNLLSASGHSRSVENLLTVWETSTPAADIAKSACEREGHVRSASNMAASPVSETSLPAETSFSARRGLSDVSCSRKELTVTKVASDLRFTQHSARQKTPVRSATPRLHTPTVAVNVCITNLFSYSETERNWLLCDQASMHPTRAAQSVKSVSGRKTPLTAPRALKEALAPASICPVKVSLYCRPLLVHLPKPSLHTAILCAAGDSAVVKKTIALLYYVPCVLVPQMFWSLVHVAMVLFVMTAGLAAIDTAWGRWPILSVYTAELHEDATELLLATREFFFSLGAVRE